MATKPFIRFDTPWSSGGLEIGYWQLVNGDDGEPVLSRYRSDRTVQVYGTFGSGGSVAIEGSLDPDGADWRVLCDPHQLDLNIAVAKIESVLQATYLIRPVVTAGDGNTDLTVILFMLGTRG